MYKKSYVYIDDISILDILIWDIISRAESRPLLFEQPHLKYIFFDRLKKQEDVSVLNCELSWEAFCEKYRMSSNFVIYNNVNKCDCDEIIDHINKHKGILVC